MSWYDGLSVKDKYCLNNIAEICFKNVGVRQKDLFSRGVDSSHMTWTWVTKLMTLDSTQWWIQNVMNARAREYVDGPQFFKLIYTHTHIFIYIKMMWGENS